MRCRMLFLRLLTASIVAVAFTEAPGFGQTAPVRNPQAVILLGQAISRLNSTSVPVSDVSLTANAAYTAGSDQESGTATLEASGVLLSRLVLNLSNGQREEIRNGSAGAWVGTDGTAHAMALHNCWVDAAWFYPLLSLEAASSDPTVSVGPGTQTTLNGEAIDELILSRTVPNQAAGVTAEIQQLSTVDLFLDGSTLLPVELDFDLHPDNDANQDIPVEIQFSGYRPVGGALVPFHIQKFIQHNLLLDLQISGATVNSGLTAADFPLPAVSGGQQ